MYACLDPSAISLALLQSSCWRSLIVVVRLSPPLDRVDPLPLTKELHLLLVPCFLSSRSPMAIHHCSSPFLRLPSNPRLSSLIQTIFNCVLRSDSCCDRRPLPLLLFHPWISFSGPSSIAIILYQFRLPDCHFNRNIFDSRLWVPPLFLLRRFHDSPSWLLEESNASGSS